MMPPVCYTAAAPLFVYAVLLMLGWVERTDASVSVLFFTEAIAIIITVWNLGRRYRARYWDRP